MSVAVFCPECARVELGFGENPGSGHAAALIDGKDRFDDRLALAASAALASHVLDEVARFDLKAS